MSEWNGMTRSPMRARKTGIKRKARRKPVLAADVRMRVLERASHVCAYGGGYASTVDHVVPKQLRLRYGIAFDDERYLVACSMENNVRKLTRKLYPVGFDVSLLPGKGWQEWRGGPLPEVMR